MLLIGSRAIVRHLPDFRPPRDWDLIGTDADIARLDRVLVRSSKHPSRPEKAYYDHAGVLVEVANASVVPYWAKVLATFADEPAIDDPVLGRLTIAPIGFLLLTKQCGLIYRIAHWHKNLEDLYWLRDRVQTIPPHAAALLPDAIADSRRMFAEGHARHEGYARPCHPALRGPADPELHRALHDRLALRSAPAASEPRAWEGFPERRPEERRERMIDLFAEETMVLGATRSRAPVPDAEPDAEPMPPGEAQLARWALRNLITSALPEGLRYFGVNHYREIMERVPRGWLSRSG